MGPKGKIVTEVEVVFVSPHNHVLPRAFSLKKLCSSNVAEQKVLIGLKLAQ